MSNVTNAEVQFMIREALYNWDFTDFPEVKVTLEAMKNAEFEQYEIDEYLSEVDDYDGLYGWALALV